MSRRVALSRPLAAVVVAAACALAAACVPPPPPALPPVPAPPTPTLPPPPPTTVKPPAPTTTVAPAPSPLPACNAELLAAAASAGAGPSAVSAPLTVAAARAEALSAAAAADTVVLVTVDGAGRPDVEALPAVAAVGAAEVAAASGKLVAVAPRQVLRPAGTLDPAGPVAPSGAGPDPLRHLQWAFDSFAFEAARGTGGAGVVVAVVDTGVDGTHPDFGGRVLPGASVIAGVTVPGAGANDHFGHGTHVAGTVAAGAGDGVGVVGVAPEAAVLPVAVFFEGVDHEPVAYSDDVASGIVWAVDEGADVVNLSLGGPVPDAAIEAAIDYAVANGVVVVASAGNTGPEHTWAWPGALPQVIAVAALAPSLVVAPYSTVAPYVDIAAPGSQIASTVPGEGWAYASGTSMAAPHVSGVAALMKALDGDLTHAEVAAKLASTASDCGPAGPDSFYGAGALNPRAAVDLDA